MNTDKFSQDEKDMILNELGKFTVETSNYVNGQIDEKNYEYKCDRIVDLIRRIQKCKTIDSKISLNQNSRCSSNPDSKIYEIHRGC